MKIFVKSVCAILRRPFILLFFAVVTLAISALNEINPIIPILRGLSSITNTNFFENIVSYLQLLLDPDIIPMVAAFTLISCILASLLIALVLSGFLHIINKTIFNKQKTKGEYREGLRKYFGRILVISLKVLILTVLFVLFILVVSVPGIVITIASITGKPQLIVPAVFVDILTIFVVFFGTMFFKTYILFWYPAALNNEKRYFSAGRKVVDKKFWPIALRLLIFDIIFVLFEYVSIYIRDFSLFFVIAWVFNTVFFTMLIIYVFSAYREYSTQA